MAGVKGTTVKPSQALSLDVNQQKIFIKFWNKLGEKPATTVRFFDRSDYYSLHSDDAHLAANSIFKSIAQVKTMAPGDEVPDLDYICLTKGNFEILLRELLLVKNYRVEVYTKGKSKEWTLEFTGSPGNLVQFESMLFANSNEMVISTCVIALNLKVVGQQRHIGMACIDVNERLISVNEFDDDDFFSNLEAMLVLLGPKECVLPSSADADFVRIKTLLDRNSIMITTVKRADFSIEKSDLMQDLTRLLHFKEGQKADINICPEILKTFALTSLGALLKYLNLVDDSYNLGHFKIELIDFNRFVHLDAAAVTALNLLPKPGTSVTSPAYKWHSILGVLDRCLTAQGHRLMAQWVKQPLRNLEMIKDRHDIVQCFIEATISREEFCNDLKKIPDILMLAKKLMRKKASLQDIYRLYQVVIRMPKILSLLSELENSTVENVLFKPMKNNVADLNLFKQMVEQVIDADSLEKGEYLIKPSFDNQLNEMNETMTRLEEKMKKELRKEAENLNLDAGTSMKLDYVSKLGYHFRISLRDDAVLRKDTKRYKTLDAIKGGVRFTTDKLTDLNDEYNQLKESYEGQQESIVEEIVRVALGYLGSFTLLNNQIAQLDCLLSFAVAAVSAPRSYIRPQIFGEGYGTLELRELRHPCLELQDDVIYVANDAIFKKDETNMFIITGPNMGGKSTYIRSVGAAVVMAHIGSFVPCESAKISIVDSIFGRIGADDNINKGLSTFMVEMIETAGIIRTATSNSLVVIDELGRGTSTYEGCGIAWAIAEHLAKEVKCFSLFATHFHEITELEKMVPSAKNSHMVAIANRDAFTLLYQVRPGVMDKSFGIHVAKLANFPNEVVDMAQQIYDENEDHYGSEKSEDDELIIKLFSESVDRLLAKMEIYDDELISIAKDISSKVKESNSAYFRNLFPALFV